MKKQKFFMMLVRMFACIIRTVCPKVAVKCFTLKSNTVKQWSHSSCGRYGMSGTRIVSLAEMYLPSPQKQLATIKKLDFGEKEIQAREWSLETKIQLLRDGNYALVSEVSTPEEFGVLLDSKRIDKIAAAMKAYTPNKESMLRILEFQSSPEKLVGANPAAFDNLQPWEILGVEQGKPCALKNSRWNFAKALVTLRPNVNWASKFMLELRNLVPNELGDEGKELFIQFYKFADEREEDMTELLPYMSVFFSWQYAEIKLDIERNKHEGAYFQMMFPQLIKYLANGQETVKDINGSHLLEDNRAADAYDWLVIGYYNCNDSRIYDCLLHQLRNLRKVISVELYNQLFERMVDVASSCYDVQFLLNMTEGEEFYGNKLRAKLAEYGDSSTLVEYFPFTGWEADAAEKALIILAAYSKIPVARLDELTPELKKKALELMESFAQIDAVRQDAFSACEYPLCQEAQYELFRDRGLEKYQLRYLELRQISDETFLKVISNQHADIYAKEWMQKLVGQYASKYGLSERLYTALLQSPIREHCLQWRAAKTKTEQ